MHPPADPCTCPYEAVPKAQKWIDAVANVADDRINPHTAARFPLDRTAKVASAGSCFAQRISESLVARGFNYHVTEAAPRWLPADRARAYSYGVYSARYGNVYTPLQLVQLVQRTLGTFAPEEGPWPGEGGRWYDPFRPQHPAQRLLLGARVDGRSGPPPPGGQVLVGKPRRVHLHPGNDRGLAPPRRGRLPRLPGVCGRTVLAGRLRVPQLLGPRSHRPPGPIFPPARRRQPPRPRDPHGVAGAAHGDHDRPARPPGHGLFQIRPARRRGGDGPAHPNADYFASYEIAVATRNTHRYYAADKRSVTPEGVAHVMDAFFGAPTSARGGRRRLRRGRRPRRRPPKTIWFATNWPCLKLWVRSVFRTSPERERRVEAKPVARTPGWFGNDVRATQGGGLTMHDGRTVRIDAVTKPTPIYVLGDSHVLGFKDLFFRDTYTGGDYYTVSRYYSGFAAGGVSSGGALVPAFVKALEYEGLLKEGRAAHLRVGPMDLAVAYASGSAQAPALDYRLLWRHRFARQLPSVSQRRMRPHIAV